MADPARCFLNSVVLGKNPRLSYLVDRGLPSVVRWRLLRVGPEYSFEFDLLARSGARYENALVERFSPYVPALSSMLRIGSYTYSFLGARQESDVCVCDRDGAFWIIDPNKQSIATQDGLGGAQGEPLPIYCQYVNSGGEPFEKCLDTYLQYIERSCKPTKDAAAARSVWLSFEDYIRQTDPKALIDDTAFWQCILGERLGPY